MYTPPSCPDPGIGLPSTPLELPFILGESALNVIEAASAESNFNFVLNNIFGLFYSLHTVESVSMTSQCGWCTYFTPPSSTEYLLTAGINNFIIPLSGGTITLKYKDSCSAAMDDFNRKSLSDIHIPIPPHYNPFFNPRKERTKDCTAKDHCRID